MLCKYGNTSMRHTLIGKSAMQCFEHSLCKQNMQGIMFLGSVW